MVCADKGFAPIYPGHEPVMFLLHQPADSPRGIRTLACDDENIMSLPLDDRTHIYIKCKNLCDIKFNLNIVIF